MTVVSAIFAAVAVLGMTGPAVPVTGPGSGLVITDPTAGAVHLLIPGTITQWSIGVTTTAVQLDSLRIRVTVPTASDSELIRHLSFSLSGCTAAWVGRRCPATVLRLAPMTAALDWTDRLIPVALADGVAPQQLNLLLGATLDDVLAPQSKGQATSIRIQVLATGEQGGSPGIRNDLPDTGFGVLRALLTGVAPIALGLALARLGRRLTRARPS